MPLAIPSGLTGVKIVRIGVPLRLVPSWFDRPMPPSASASPASTWLARNSTTATAKIAPAAAAASTPMSRQSHGLVMPHSVDARTA